MSVSRSQANAVDLASATITELVQTLIATGRPLVLVETCTGGAIAATLTAQPGASRVLRWGLCLYDHSSKADFLGISPQVFIDHASVSQAAVRALSQAAYQRLTQQDPATTNSAMALAVSGIAGPSGARPGKPVGHCWMALSQADATHCKSLQLPPERSPYREQATRAALTWLLQSA